MTWRGTEEHEALYLAALSLVKALREMEHRLEHGDTQHLWHTDLAIRCRSLAMYLDSAIASAERDEYAPAFGTLRSALEHVLIDELIFLGQRYVQVFKSVDDATWARLEQERSAGTAWMDVTEWVRTKKGELRITREGIHSQPAEDGSRQTIGIHYFLLQQYSPTVGTPGVQQYFDDGISNPDVRRKHAEENRDMYDRYLKWASLKESLKANGFADDTVLRQIDVHYAFLSTFVHPNTDCIADLYGRNMWNWPVYDHYSSELVLLYAIVLAVRELRNFYAMSQRKPTVAISSWDKTDELCNRAWKLSSHLWFPGQEPHEHDRFDEANRRIFRVLQEGGARPSINPAALPVNEIGYYQNPLKRLIELHATKQELMSGLGYVSPWHRPDAQLR